LPQQLPQHLPQWQQQSTQRPAQEPEREPTIDGSSLQWHGQQQQSQHLVKQPQQLQQPFQQPLQQSMHQQAPLPYQQPQLACAVSPQLHAAQPSAATDDALLTSLVSGAPARPGAAPGMPSPLAVAQDDLVLRMLMGGRDALGLTQGAKKQRPRSACGRRLKADVHRREDVQRIYRSLGQADCSLQRDMQVGASYLPRGSRLLREGPVKRGRPLKAALEAICLPASLLFEAPPKDAWEAPRAHKARGAAAADAAAGLLHGVASYDWCCPLPCCRAPYPVQAPIETTARALLARLVPEIVDFEPPATDLWTNCGLQDTARARRGDPELVEGAPPCTALADEQGHELDEYRAPSDGFGCGQCGAHIETSDTMRGCIDCRFFVCMPCFARALDGGGFDLRPLPPPHELRRQRERQDRERTLRALVDSAPGHFDLSPVLHFGRVRRRPPMHGKERPEDARLLRRGPSGELVPLADPYAYLRARCAAARGRGGLRHGQGEGQDAPRGP